MTEPTIGKLIKQLRIHAGYKTLGRLHKVSGVTVATLSRIEDGIQKPLPETLKKLASCLGVTHEELMRSAGYLESKVASATDVSLRQINRYAEAYIEVAEVARAYNLTPEQVKALIKATGDVWDPSPGRKHILPTDDSGKTGEPKRE